MTHIPSAFAAQPIRRIATDPRGRTSHDPFGGLRARRDIAAGWYRRSCAGLLVLTMACATQTDGVDRHERAIDWRTLPEVPVLTLAGIDTVCGGGTRGCIDKPHAAIAASPLGHILVSDVDSRVHLFNPARGAWTLIGGRGAGPGEYLAPTTLSVADSGNVVAVFDEALFRVTETGLVPSSQRTRTIAPMGALDAAAFSGGTLYVLRGTTRPRNDVPVRLLLALNADGRADTLFEMPVADHERTRDFASDMVPIPPPFAPRAVIAAGSDAVALARGNSDTVRILARRGPGAIVPVVIGWSPVAVTEAELREAVAERARRSGGRSSLQREAERSLLGTRTAAGRYHPAITALVALADGAFAVRGTIRPNADECDWALVRADGQPLGMLRIPATMSVVGGHASEPLLSIETRGGDARLIVGRAVIRAAR